MRLNRYIFAAATTLWLASGQQSVAENYCKGEKTVGLGAGYHSCNRSAVAGIGFTYRFGRHFRLAPGVNYVFRHHDTDALCIDINAEVPFTLSPRWDIYPLAGITYASWIRHGTLREWAGNHDVGDRTSRLGLNAGAGANLTLSSNLRLGLSAAYTMVKEYNGVEILARISYCF